MFLHMLTEERIDQIISEEIKKSDVENIANNKISASYNSKEFKNAVSKIAADVIEDLYKTLWNRSSTWKGVIAR